VPRERESERVNVQVSALNLSGARRWRARGVEVELSCTGIEG
jgi:hypothetical protein